MILQDLIQNHRVILASASPRRHQLLKGMAIDFDVKVTNTDESYPPELDPEEVAKLLSIQKSEAFPAENMADNELIITADTLVSIHGKILPKPENNAQASEFLQLLSDRMHIVYTGVTLKTKNKTTTFSAETKVWFKKLTPEEIEFYVSTYHPIDKAGAYGAQEWIGFIAICKIEGSYFNVMGLPTQKLYTELIQFLSDDE